MIPVTLTLNPADMDAIATGLGVAFAAMPFDELADKLALAADTQGTSPTAQTTLRLLAEVIRLGPEPDDAGEEAGR